MLLVTLVSCGGRAGTSPSPATTATPATSASPSTISSLSGEVLLQKQGSTTWVQAVAGMKLEAGDDVKTGGNGTAVILFFEGSTMEVQPDTEILINEFSLAGTGSTTIGLKQVVGNTINRVQKLVDSASRYEVDTPAGSAAVRGTVFRVMVQADGYTVVMCDEGQVWFTAAGVTVLIRQGQQSSASVGGAPSNPSPSVTSTPGPTYSPIAKPIATPSPKATAVPLLTPLPVIILPGGGSAEVTPTPTPTPTLTPTLPVPEMTGIGLFCIGLLVVGILVYRSRRNRLAQSKQ